MKMNEVVHSTSMRRWPGVLSSRKGKGQNYFENKHISAPIHHMLMFMYVEIQMGG